MPFHVKPAGFGCDWMFAKCDRCGYDQSVAVGFKIEEITIQRRLRSAILMGWRVAPTLICPRCQYRERTGL